MTNIKQNLQFTPTPPVLGVVSVDSLKVRIPLEHVEILDPVVNEKWYWVSESGEIDPDKFKQNALERYADQNEIVKIRFGIEKQRTDIPIVQKFLTMLLPAKILKERYFEGFTIDNIETVYNTLMSMGVVKFSKYIFLHHSACTDVDFKKDFRYNNMDLLISKLSSKVNPSKNRGDGIRRFRDSDNKGIEFNERKTSRYKTRPFIKIYHKGIELATIRRKPFTETYLKGIDLDGLCRIEATVKNKKHFKHLDIDRTSLNCILSLNQNQMNNIISKAIKCNLEPRNASFRTPKELTPNKQMIYNAIYLLLNQGIDFTSIRIQLLNGIVDRFARSKKGKEIDQLYNDHLRGKKVDRDAEELVRIYNVIGWE